MKIKFFVVIISLFQFQCDISRSSAAEAPEQRPSLEELRVGAENLDLYWPLISDKKVAMVVNQTSRLGDRHLIDSLLSLGLQIEKIFSPEHGFRGTADAGQKITDGKDAATGIPIISLYGKKRKPSKEDLSGLDWVIFDIQDVGARFYTYISSMHYVMQACAENELPFMILDRPNPNGHYVDGPVLDPGFASFVGMHPVPVVHGLTVGEYATMLNEEGWLQTDKKCRLEVIPCSNYDHQTAYVLPVKPSPNLPNIRAVYLYPWLCFFEGTQASIGRGTDKQFQVIGLSAYPEGDYEFTPVPRPGARYPKHRDQLCRGYDLSNLDPVAIRQEGRLNLSYLLNFYKHVPQKEEFFLKTNFFDKLAGSSALREQIEQGWTEEQIRQSWEPALSRFRALRQKHLIYP